MKKVLDKSEKGEVGISEFCKLGQPCPKKGFCRVCLLVLIFFDTRCPVFRGIFVEGNERPDHAEGVKQDNERHDDVYLMGLDKGMVFEVESVGLEVLETALNGPSEPIKIPCEVRFVEVGEEIDPRLFVAPGGVLECHEMADVLTDKHNFRAVQPFSGQKPPQSARTGRSFPDSPVKPDGQLAVGFEAHNEEKTAFGQIEQPLFAGKLPVGEHGGFLGRNRFVWPPFEQTVDQGQPHGPARVAPPPQILPDEGDEVALERQPDGQQIAPTGLAQFPVCPVNDQGRRGATLQGQLQNGPKNALLKRIAYSGSKKTAQPGIIG